MPADFAQRAHDLAGDAPVSGREYDAHSPLGPRRADEPRGGAAGASVGRKKLPLTLGAALIEQALFAGTNFLATMLLVRWVAIEEVGAFSFAYASFLLTQMICDTIVVEPIAIFGAAKYAARIGIYSGIVLYGLFAAAGVAALALTTLALVCLVIPSPVLAAATFGAAMAAPLLFLRSMTQQLCYVRARAGLFALCGFVYAVEMPGFLYLLHMTGSLTAASALVAMGLATAIPSMTVILAVLRPELRPSHIRRSVRNVMVDHWGYGRWSSAGQTMQWIGLNAYYMLGPLFIGLTAVAAIRPLFNLILPVQMAVTSILSASVPALSAACHGNLRQFRKLFWALAGGCLLLTLGYSSMLILVGHTVIHLIYWGAFDRFLTLPMLLSLAAMPVMNAMSGVLEIRMRVDGQIKRVAMIKVLWVTATMTIGIGSCAWLGLPGVFIGWMTCCAIVLTGNCFISRNFLRGAYSSGQLLEDRPHPLPRGEQKMLPI
jgi:O-antigen/teichoic acid export membrane protein